MSRRWTLIVLTVAAVTACKEPPLPAHPGDRPATSTLRTVRRPPPGPMPNRALSAPEVLALRPYTTVAPIGSAVERFLAGDAASCVRLLDGALTKPSEDKISDPKILPRARYLLGVCLHFSGEQARGLETLAPLVESYPLLANYARYFSARCAKELGQTERALAFLRAIPSDSSQRRRASELTIELLSGGPPEILKKQLAEHLARFPNAPTSVRAQLATASEAAGAKRDAVLAWWDLWTRSPLSTEAAGAEAAVKRIVQSLPPDERGGLEAPGVERRLKRARRLFRAHRSERAIEALAEVIRRTKPGDPIWCEAENLTARSWDKLRKRKRSVPYYDALMKSCAHDKTRVDVLYFGGKSAHQEGLRERAISFFEKLHREFPEHSYNDDALLREANIYEDEGQPKKARAALQRALDAYPDGDMREDAAWGILWADIRAGHTGDALRTANRILSLIPHERSFRSAGRTLYWKGRTLQRLGELDAADEVFRLCIERYPITWYSGLAYARLRERDAASADERVREIVAHDTAPPGPLSSSEPLPVTERPAFRRGLELLRLGLTSPAARELSQLRDDVGDDPATDWLLAALWAQAGEYPTSHNIARRKQPGFARHYPKGDHEQYWRIAYPRPYRTLAAEAARRESIPASLIHAIMREESGFSPGIESWANAVGLMQLLVPTARDVAERVDGSIDRAALKSPRVNIRLGARFLARLYHRFGDHPALAASGYNAGVGRMKRWLSKRGELPIDEFVESIPFRQTRGYTKRVVQSYLRYEWLYGERPGAYALIPLNTETKAPKP